MLFRSRFLELLVPAPHVLFAETGSAHNRRPLLFRDHLISPQLICSGQQPRDGALMLAESLDGRPDLAEPAAQNRRSVVGAGIEQGTNIGQRQTGVAVEANLAKAVEIACPVAAV